MPTPTARGPRADWQRWQRWARRGTTTQRGLGAEHQALRSRLLAVLADGAPCPERPRGPGTPACGRPMVHPARCTAPPDRADGRCFTCRLDLCHATARALGGTGDGAFLGHARCNRQAGAWLRAHLHRVQRRQVPPTW